MFRRARQTGIERVEVQFARVNDIARHHRALEKMDIVQTFNNACGIIKVLQIAFAVFVVFHVDNMHCGTGGTEMNLVTLGV